MILLRVYLLLGLIAHKALWEILKRRAGVSARRPRQTSGFSTLVKIVKAVLLIALAAQTVLPEILPIAEDPVILRVAGILLFTLGLALAMAARIELGDNWLDIEDAQVRPDQALIATGVYKYVRHPIYVGDLLLLIGLELSLNSWLVLAVGVLIPVIVARARMEESMLSQALRGYDEYRERTYSFLPFVV
jgi:protein-S-isoprenylcysteine O-methyltransferase Ste14